MTNVEDLLAHYTTSDVAFGHVLPEGRLRMSPYRLMRDPVENKDIVPGIQYYAEDEFGDFSVVTEEVKTIRDSCRLLSLTGDATDLEVAGDTFGACWARPRMWEQYGDNHRGVCLVFDKARLEPEVFDKLAVSGEVHVGNVRYTRAGIADSAADAINVRDIRRNRDHRRAAAAYVSANYEDFFFLKSNDFESEHEYRVVVLMNSDDEYGYFHFKRSLEAVVLGERFPAWQIPAAHSICEVAQVELHQVRWDEGVRTPFSCPCRPTDAREGVPNRLGAKT